MLPPEVDVFVQKVDSLFIEADNLVLLYKGSTVPQSQIEGIGKAAVRVGAALSECSLRCTQEKKVQIAGYWRNIYAVLVQLNRAIVEAKSAVQTEYSQLPSGRSTPYIAEHWRDNTDKRRCPAAAALAAKQQQQTGGAGGGNAVSKQGKFFLFLLFASVGDLAL